MVNLLILVTYVFAMELCVNLQTNTRNILHETFYARDMIIKRNSSKTFRNLLRTLCYRWLPSGSQRFIKLACYDFMSNVFLLSKYDESYTKQKGLTPPQGGPASPPVNK